MVETTKGVMSIDAAIELLQNVKAQSLAGKKPKDVYLFIKNPGNIFSSILSRVDVVERDEHVSVTFWSTVSNWNNL